MQKLNMTFKGILDQIGTWGAQHALPVFFGDEATRNRLANDITGDFIFVDVPGGRQDYNDYAAGDGKVGKPSSMEVDMVRSFFCFFSNEFDLET